jgi:hypothetical protein
MLCRWPMFLVPSGLERVESLDHSLNDDSICFLAMEWSLPLMSLSVSLLQWLSIERLELESSIFLRDILKELLATIPNQRRLKA